VLEVHGADLADVERAGQAILAGLPRTLRTSSGRGSRSLT